MTPERYIIRSMELSLSSPVQYVPRVGPMMANRLKKLNIRSVEDLLMYVPFRYDDYSLISPIAAVQPGEAVTLTGVVDSIRNAITKSGKRMQEAVVSDASGKLEVIWFNQPFLLRLIQKGDSLRLAGKVDWFGHKLVMSSPSYEVTGRDPVSSPLNSVRPPLNMTGSRPVSNESLHSGRLVPIYPETEGISSKWLRGRVAFLLQTILPLVEDPLPVDVQKTHHLMPLPRAISAVHFPDSLDEAKNAKHRLAFDEVFFLMLRARHQKLLREENARAPAFTSVSEDIASLVARLPFTLTDDQNKVIGEVALDLARSVPMNRLLMGDVGSGKTIIAAIAMYSAYGNGLQSLLMAPTEILANQHYETISTLLTPFGVKVGIVTGSQKSQNQNSKRLGFNVLIGTHALLSKSMTYTNVGLIVIDEQHRFGVEQRQLLGQKGEGGATAHLLTMTATPIPRTVARTIFGNVDLSVITQMPKGRQKIKTWLVPKEKREKAYEWMKKELRKSGGQAYIVCPLIEESETLTSVRAVKTEYEKLKTIFQGFTLGLLHGRMKPKEKIAALDRFRTKKDTILVATPVVEVGIDIPSAILILIEAADRFGLAQLHQLRGRVGRGEIGSYCLLFSDTEDELTIKRLKSLETIHNGPELADVDLALRGPGELFGSRQHGIPPLRIASFSDTQLLEESQRAVSEYLQTDPHLENPLLRKRLLKSTINNVQQD